MEKGLGKLIEAARTAADMEQDHMILLEILPEGVRARIVWEEGQKKYSQENTTSWRAIHQSRTNPLISAMDALVRARTEFTP